MRPSSGLWNPQMIFIRVDFPAPLSPSKPSTSPLRRRRFTSRSAVIGPKPLLICSTRRTSFSPEVGATTRSAAASGSGNRSPPSHAADKYVCRHRDDDRGALIEAQVVGVHALDYQAVLQDPQEEGPDQRPDHGPGAAGQQGAADHSRRDAVEEDRVGARRVGLNGGRARGLEDTDDAGAEAADDEVADDHTADSDAG